MTDAEKLKLIVTITVSFANASVSENQSERWLAQIHDIATTQTRNDFVIIPDIGYTRMNDISEDDYGWC